jgi:hypothetical protein
MSSMLLRKMLIVICLPLFAWMAMPSYGQEDLSQHWNGVWNAQGTLFTIAIEVENGVMKITQIESLGFEWTNMEGKIEGNTASVAVDYIGAGVTGVIQMELVDANTATAFAATCTPEFMVACALAKGRQAVFRRVNSN